MTIEVPPPGSRGVRFPGGRVIRGGMRMVAGLYRLTGGRSGRNSLLLTTVGARSGERRTASLRRFDDGDGRWLVVGSAGGSAKHPAWKRIVAEAPQFGGYEHKTDRDIPVIRLTREP